MKEAIEKNDMTYQLVPPNDHRRNAAEKAVQIFKDHFVAVLCGTDDAFPMQLWCQLVPHAECQLNMLRRSVQTPTISSFAHLYGQHNYDAHPFAILGSAVEIHVMPKHRKTWDTHTKSGYYLGPSWEHYRCHDVWVTDTRARRVGQTVFFKHKYLTQPTITPNDALLRAGDNLCSALTNAAPGDEKTQRAVDLLVEIFQKTANDAKSNIDQRRGLREDAQTQRVQTEEKANADTASTECEPTSEPVKVDDDGLRMEGLTVTYPSHQADSGPAIISQDDDTPARNTRSARQRLYSATEISDSCPTPTQASRRHFPLQFLVDYASAVLDDETGELLEYRHLIQRPKYKKDWGFSFGNEIGRLAQGMPGRNTGTNTIFFILKSEIPQERWKDVAYSRIVCNVRPQKAEVNRTRLTYGGSNLDVDIDCGTPTANLLTVKLLLNSVISTPGAKFMAIDIKDFYLNTPLHRPEYLRMKLNHFPDDVIAHYGLKEKVDAKGFVYVKCVRGMYGLPHAGIIAQRLLEERLNKADYYQSDVTPGFWKHKWRPISFSLIVDDFGVKYVGKEHADHLISVLNEHYTISTDWEGAKYSGITLDWDYAKRQVHLSMPGYCKEALTRFAHKLRKANDQPHRHTIPAFGAKVQYAPAKDNSPPLSKEDTKFIQQVTGTFLYYARAVDPTMLVALSAIAAGQAAPTARTMEKCLYFLDYAATHPDAILTYSASDMILSVHSDASYLTEPKARSRAGGHFCLSNNAEYPPNNGAVLNIAQIIRNVMTSAADAEIGALYINARHAIPARNLLIEMGHEQPATPVQTDNTTALGFVTRNLHPKQTKSVDMNHWYMRDKQDQKQFRYYWRAGPNNDADYHSKHHSPSHHREKRPRYLTPKEVLDTLRISQGKIPLCF